MYYRQPRYFGEFYCIGNACSDNCCYGWRIDWHKEEVDKLKNAKNISLELKELVEKSFIPNEILNGEYQIKFDERGKCPCVTEDGWCRIQRELGVEYLSGTCMVYPRRYVVTESVAYRFCHSSCREVMAKLMNDEKSMDLINSSIKQNLVLKTDVTYDKPEKIADYPERKFREELFEFFYDLIANKRNDVETNIILGALAAQSITKLVSNEEIDRIPEALKSFRQQMHNNAQIKMIENIKPNYVLRFGFIAQLLKDIVGFSMIEMLNDSTGTPNIDYYNDAKQYLYEKFKDRPFYLRNIALNLLFELTVPFRHDKKTIFENYSLFAVAYACIKLNLISISMLSEKVNVNIQGQQFHYEGDDRFVGLTSIICRRICQNLPKGELIIDRLNQNGFTTPAYLALLVK